MRVVYLNPTGEIGGAEASLLTLITALRQERPDFEPYVIATAAGALPDRCAELKIPFHVLALPAGLQRIGDAPTRGGLCSAVASTFGILGTGPHLARYRAGLASVLKRAKPDLLHSNGFKMHLLAASVCGHRSKHRIPLVGHIHDYVSRRPVSGNLLRWCAGRFRWFVANSESVARDLRSFLQTDRVSSVYNAVDANRYAPFGEALDLDSLCGLPPAPAGTVRIGLSATFAKWKGHLTFLRALAALHPELPVRGYIIGGPIYRTAGSQHTVAELEGERDRLGLRERVGFTGFLPDTSGALRALDIAVHASTDPEPFGLAIVEAMACARAVIVSNGGGAAELFEEGVTGLGHLPGDVRQLAEQMTRLASDPALRVVLGRTARKRVMAEFSTQEMAKRFLRVYEEAANRAFVPCLTAQ
jgi:glycosyltransferase involved in cell wall biosynthesis